MRFFSILLAAALIVGCREIRRDTPDETKVQAYPQWRAAPNDDLPVPK